MPETLLLEAPLGDAGQKRALEDDESGKRKARRVQVKNKCEHDRFKDGKCKDYLSKHEVKRGDCKEGCSQVPSSQALFPAIRACSAPLPAAAA